MKATGSLWRCRVVRMQGKGSVIVTRPTHASSVHWHSCKLSISLRRQRADFKLVLVRLLSHWQISASGTGGNYFEKFMNPGLSLNTSSLKARKWSASQASAIDACPVLLL